MWSPIKLDFLFYDFFMICYDFFKNSGKINLKSVLEKEPGLLHFVEFTRGLLAKEDNSRNTTLGI